MDEKVDRSDFVTRLAWMFIVPAGFMTFTSLVQMVMAYVMFPGGAMRELFGYLPVGNMPGVFGFVTSNIHVLFVGCFVISALAFISAMGLLRRKNWARIVFIVVLVLGLVSNVLGIIMLFSVFPLVRGIIGGEVPEQFDMIFNAVQVSALLLTVATAGLFGWIIRKLVSPPINAEFRK
jgi:hypothetical protein